LIEFNVFNPQWTVTVSGKLDPQVKSLPTQDNGALAEKNSETTPILST
jgi:hypothetical protein